MPPMTIMVASNNPSWRRGFKWSDLVIPSEVEEFSSYRFPLLKSRPPQPMERPEGRPSPNSPLMVPGRHFDVVRLTIRKRVARTGRPGLRTSLQAKPRSPRPQRAKKFLIQKNRNRRRQTQPRWARVEAGTTDGDCRNRQLQQTGPWQQATNQRGNHIFRAARQTNR